MGAPRTPLFILRGARALLASGPYAWTQHVTARDADRLRVPHDSPRAASWDIRGALKQAAGLRSEDFMPWDDELDVEVGLARLAGVDDLCAWNDRPERTVDEVLALMDRGIAELEEKK